MTTQEFSKANEVESSKWQDLNGIKGRVSDKLAQLENARRDGAENAHQVYTAAQSVEQKLIAIVDDNQLFRAASFVSLVGLIEKRDESADNSQCYVVGLAGAVLECLSLQSDKENANNAIVSTIIDELSGLEEQLDAVLDTLSENFSNKDNNLPEIYDYPDLGR